MQNIILVIIQHTELLVGAEEGGGFIFIVTFWLFWLTVISALLPESENKCVRLLQSSARLFCLRWNAFWIPVSGLDSPIQGVAL